MTSDARRSVEGGQDVVWFRPRNFFVGQVATMAPRSRRAPLNLVAAIVATAFMSHGGSASPGASNNNSFLCPVDGQALWDPNAPSKGRWADSEQWLFSGSTPGKKDWVQIEGSVQPGAVAIVDTDVSVGRLRLRDASIKISDSGGKMSFGSNWTAESEIQ